MIVGVRFDSMISNKFYRQALFYEMLAFQTIVKVDPVQHGPRNRKLIHSIPQVNGLRDDFGLVARRAVKAEQNPELAERSNAEK